jgi:predicted DCC family thiol-disulfide oxidoreductase YuxK
MANPILFYDGVCGLCNRLVQFVLRRDRAGIFRFAALQSSLAERMLAKHLMHAGDLDTVYVVLDFELLEERLLTRSEAIIFVLMNLKGWHSAARLLELMPRSLREWGYRLIARNRYRIFGRFESCLVPDKDQRSRFLDN